MKQNELTNKKEHHNIMLKKLISTSDKIGYTKLLLVLLLGVLVFFIFARNFPPILIILGVIGLVLLIILWVSHYKWHEKIKYSKGIVAICSRHLARISGKWPAFPDIGDEFIDSNHPYSSDLDIVGKKSFFQFLNTTHTWHGRKAFAEALLQPSFFNDELILRQDSVAELSADIDEVVHMEHCFSKIGVHKSAEKLADNLGDKSIFINSTLIKILLLFGPLVTAALIASVFIFGHSFLLLIAIGAVVVQGLTWIIGMSKAHGYLGPISRLPYSLEAYSDVINMITSRDYESPRLQQIQGQLGANQQSAAQAIKVLGRIADKVNIKHNALLWFAVNVLLLWDFWCAMLFEKWKLRYADEAVDWLPKVGEFESLLCFANLPNICNNTCLPGLSGDIKACSMGHPLISGGARVDNDFVCNNNILIISGSNMSGKTTFMRTLGINLVLAKAGSFVCANKMYFAPLEIMSSMRIADDLNEGISTFYAELNRIKGIIALGEKEPRMIFLIDEIFKGTNSIDRLSGAKSVIAKLEKLGAVGVITTHDLELCEIAVPDSRIVNYSFSEEYRNGRIYFDYKIKPGRSTTTNAKYLMEMVGI